MVPLRHFAKFFASFAVKIINRKGRKGIRKVRKELASGLAPSRPRYNSPVALIGTNPHGSAHQTEDPH